MRSWLVAVLLATACNRVFDIDTTNLEPDAPPPSDSDGDGVFDAQDNCPDVANDQADDDQDSVGDLCDNCPLIANPSQDLAGDDDAVGTACDPHPEGTNDCLIAFDTFTNPALYASYWETVNTGAAPAIQTQDGSVTVTPGDSAYVAIVARDTTGARLAGRFDIQLRAQFTVTGPGSLLAASSISEPSAHYGCGIRAAPQGIEAVSRSSSGATATTSGGLLSAEPVDASTLLRLTTPSSPVDAVRCRVEHGLAAGFSFMLPTTSDTPAGTNAGVVLLGSPATLESIAIYRAQSAACPPTTYR